jgi:18S rRNA (guanine1575-N7)-methyltransferase
MSRPEDTLPPDLYYSSTTASQYTTSSRIQSIQSSMTKRALSLLSLPHPSLILDIGCGSGLSGSILSAHNHLWIGLDISPDMLSLAVSRRDTIDNEGDPNHGDLFLADIGQGLPFIPGSFDAAISISAIQWLCTTPSTSEHDRPELRLRRFFDSLYASLKRGGRAVCQFYPKNDVQRDMITKAAMRSGFGVGLLVDDEGTKNEKIYLVLRVGGDVSELIHGVENVDVDDARKGRQNGINGKGRPGKSKSKEGILSRKDKMRLKGKVVKSDSRYTGRKRRPKF